MDYKNPMLIIILFWLNARNYCKWIVCMSTACLLRTWKYKSEEFRSIVMRIVLLKLPPRNTALFWVNPFIWSVVEDWIVRSTETGSSHLFTTKVTMLPVRALFLCSQLSPVQFPSGLHRLATCSKASQDSELEVPARATNAACNKFLARWYPVSS